MTRVMQILAIAFAIVGCDGDDCNALRRKLSVAVDRFAPTTSNACSSNSDCTLVSTAIVRQQKLCLEGCEIPVTRGYGAEYRDFLDRDAQVTSACEAVIAANCAEGIPLECPCYVPDGDTVCGAPSCDAGTCK